MSYICILLSNVFDQFDTYNDVCGFKFLLNKNYLNNFSFWVPKGFFLLNAVCNLASDYSQSKTCFSL